MTSTRCALAALVCLAAHAQDPAARPYWRTVVQGTHGMVAAEHPLEAIAALDALKADTKLATNAGRLAHREFVVRAVAERVRQHPSSHWIPALDAAGVFRGGLILPGIDVMLRALGENTAALRRTPGRFEAFPTTTPNALFSGAVQAACGAIEQMRRQLRGHGTEVTCYLAGGSAPDIAPHLDNPVELVDNLVLEGVLVLALMPR